MLPEMGERKLNRVNKIGVYVERRQNGRTDLSFCSIQESPLERSNKQSRTSMTTRKTNALINDSQNENLSSRRPLWQLTLTCAHRQVFLQWYIFRSTWNLPLWIRIVLNDKPHFKLKLDEQWPQKMYLETWRNTLRYWITPTTQPDKLKLWLEMSFYLASGIFVWGGGLLLLLTYIAPLQYA